MSAAPGTGGGHVRPAVALAFSTVGFVALSIAGLGLTSLALDRDVIGVPGLGQIPGIVGLTLSTAAFAATVALGLRAPRPSLWTGAVAALAAWLAEPLGILVAAVLGGADLARSVAAAAAVAIGPFGLVLAGAAGVAGWSAVALVRTRSGPPRWPWER